MKFKHSILPLAAFFLLICPGLLIAAPLGYVRDYNRITKSVTIIVHSAGAFRPGHRLLVFHDKNQIGIIKVKMSFHTRVVGKLTRGTYIYRKDIVVRSKKDFEKYTLPKNFTKISYAEVMSRARGWLVKVGYGGKTCPPDADVQVRKIVFGNEIGARKTKDTYYSYLMMKDIRSLTYTWTGKSLKGESIIFKNGKIMYYDEIITPMVFSRLKPPAACRAERQPVVVELKKAAGYTKKRPDDIAITLDLARPKKALGEGKYYFLKVYSNMQFITEYLIKGDSLAGDEVSFKYALPGYYLAPGKNKLQFYIAEAEEKGKDYFEAGEPRLVGKTTIEYGEGKFRHSFEIRGKRGKFPELVD